MKTTPKGKISRLPKALRQEVNRRLENGQKEISIAAWLNGLPEVQTMLAAEFKSKPISQQNLSLKSCADSFATSSPCAVANIAAPD